MAKSSFTETCITEFSYPKTTSAFFASYEKSRLAQYDPYVLSGLPAPLSNDMGCLSDLAARINSYHQVDSQSWPESASKCDSPIEAMLFYALCVLSYYEYCQVWVDPASSLWTPKIEKIYDIVTIQPQKPISQYRVDFWLRLDANYEPTHTSSEVVVECDGHEFHEKNKIQVAKDKQRERCIQREGLHILRFSGSEIWNDAFKCAQEVLEFLSMSLRAESSHE